YDLSKTPAQPSGSKPVEVFGATSGLTDWVSRIAIDGKVTGVYADYHYIGTGDIGGATDEETVKFLEALVTQGTIALPSPDEPSGSHALPGPEKLSDDPARVGDGPVRVLATAADQMFLDIRPEMQTKLPRY